MGSPFFNREVRANRLQQVRLEMTPLIASVQQKTENTSRKKKPHKRSACAETELGVCYSMGLG